MSTATYRSSPSSARSIRAEFGVERAGLPASVISARTWPSPGTSISSASAATGSSPRLSGRPRTRVCQRPTVIPRPRPGSPALLRCPAAASGNMAPPGRSRLPVRTLSTSTSHDASVPNSCVVVPIRPYTAAASAAASSRAIRRIVAASIPQTGAAASGVNGRARSRTASIPAVCSASRPGAARSSSNRTCTSANSRCASVPGRIGWCSSAASAVRLRRGSTTTSLPPRARSAFNRPRMSGAVISEPLDASGLAPSISRCRVRSTSGIGTDSAPPNIRAEEISLGRWSTVLAE